VKKKFVFAIFLCVFLAASSAPAATLYFQQFISSPGFYEFTVDGVTQLLLCDQFSPNVTTEPYTAMVLTLADLTGSQLDRNNDPLLLQKYQQVAILDLRAYADPSLAPDVVRAIRFIVDGHGPLTPGAQDLLDYVALQNPADFDLTGFRIFVGVGTVTQEQTGFLTPEPATYAMMSIGLIGLFYARSKRRQRIR
jgi:hypothetical protein